MEIKKALIEQYQASLKMLSQCIERCPDDLWLLGDHPRQFWRIAWHAVFFAHNYMVQTFDDFTASAVNWPDGFAAALGVSETQPTVEIEPYELPVGTMPISREDLVAYIAYLRSNVDVTIRSLDLERDETGFPWYKNMSKLSHEIMGLRHIQGHVGQLSELLMARGIDIDWVAKS